MVQWPGARILRRQELDAFLAQALSPKLYEPDQLQELKVIDKPHSLSWEALLRSGVRRAGLTGQRRSECQARKPSRGLGSLRGRSVSIPVTEAVKSASVR